MSKSVKRCKSCSIEVASFNISNGECLACIPFQKVASLPGPFKTRRTFGIEFEVEFEYEDDENDWDYVPSPDFKKWARKEDGSLDSGWEYVSPIFTGYNKPVKMIHDFCDAVKKEGAFTPDNTGTHIHLGIADFDHKQKMRLMKNALAVEPQVKKMVKRDRFRTGYVYPIIQYDDYEDKEEAIADSMDSHYTWINFSTEHPTVEIRALEGTLNAERVERWIELWLGFVKVSKKHKIKDIFEAMDRAGTRLETIKYFKDTMR